VPPVWDEYLVPILELLADGSTGRGRPRSGTGRSDAFEATIDQDALGPSRLHLRARCEARDLVIDGHEVEAFAARVRAGRANGGVLMTTARFGPDADTIASWVAPRVVLIDGDRLGRLLIEHRVGVVVARRLDVVQVDDSFFV